MPTPYAKGLFQKRWSKNLMPKPICPRFKPKPYTKVIWLNHMPEVRANRLMPKGFMAEAYVKGLWQRLMSKAYGRGLCQRLMAEAHVKGLWQRLMSKASNRGLCPKLMAEAHAKGLWQRHMSEAYAKCPCRQSSASRRWHGQSRRRSTYKSRLTRLTSRAKWTTRHHIAMDAHMCTCAHTCAMNARTHNKCAVSVDPNV